MMNDMIDELFQCPLCRFQYDKIIKVPLILPCGHSSCSTCLAQASNYGKALLCSVCNSPVPNINTLPMNTDLLDHLPSGSQCQKFAGHTMVKEKYNKKINVENRIIKDVESEIKHMTEISGQNSNEVELCSSDSDSIRIISPKSTNLSPIKLKILPTKTSVQESHLRLPKQLHQEAIFDEEGFSNSHFISLLQNSLSDRINDLNLSNENLMQKLRFNDEAKLEMKEWQKVLQEWQYLTVDMLASKGDVINEINSIERKIEDLLRVLTKKCEEPNRGEISKDKIQHHCNELLQIKWYACENVNGHLYYGRITTGQDCCYIESLCNAEVPHDDAVIVLLDNLKSKFEVLEIYFDLKWMNQLEGRIQVKVVYKNNRSFVNRFIIGRNGCTYKGFPLTSFMSFNPTERRSSKRISKKPILDSSLCLLVQFEQGHLGLASEDLTEDKDLKIVGSIVKGLSLLQLALQYGEDDENIDVPIVEQCGLVIYN